MLDLIEIGVAVQMTLNLAQNALAVFRMNPLFPLFVSI